MKRRNIQMAFIGEGLSQTGALDNLVDGDEAAEIDIKGGKLLVVVPAGTTDEQLFGSAKRLGGQLVLENGLTLSFEIEDGATGAQFAPGHSGDQADTHPDLSAIPNVPGGT